MSKSVSSIANPNIPESYINLFNHTVNSPHDEIYFIKPSWNLFYEIEKKVDDIFDENGELPSQEKMRKELDFKDEKDMMTKVENLEIKLGYPQSRIFLSYYNNFSGKKEGSSCGTCCYEDCQRPGYIRNTSVMYRNDGSVIQSSQCYCDDETHIDSCKKYLLAFYQNYKDQHTDLNNLITSDWPIIDLLYINKIIVKPTTKANLFKTLVLLNKFREKYLNNQTRYLIKEINGRIEYSRACFDPTKKNCKMDWGHLMAILVLENITKRIRIVVEEIDKAANRVVRRIETFSVKKKPSKSPTKKLSTKKSPTKKSSKSKSKSKSPTPTKKLSGKPISLSSLSNLKLGGKSGSKK